MKKKVLFLSILCLLFVTLSYIYSSFTATIAINNNKKYGWLSYSGYSEYSRTSETITITSNYIKITFTSDSWGNNY